MIRLIPLPEGEDQHRDEVDEQERGQKLTQLPAQCPRPGAEQHGPQRELRQIATRVRLEVGHGLTDVVPLLGRDGEPLDARAVEKQPDRGDRQAESQPDGPPVLLLNQVLPARVRREAGGGPGFLGRLWVGGHGFLLRQNLTGEPTTGTAMLPNSVVASA